MNPTNKIKNLVTPAKTDRCDKNGLLNSVTSDIISQICKRGMNCLEAEMHQLNIKIHLKI